MSELIKNFKEAFGLYRKDKGLILLSFVPVVIGIIVYSFIGKLIYVDFLAFLNGSLADWVDSQTWLKFISIIVSIILTLIFYFLISWTFISVVGLFASPFNDLMAARVEKIYLGKQTDDAGASFKRLLGQLIFTVFNELKKITFVMMLTLFGVFLSFFLPPIGIFVSSVLIAVSFVDYSWGQHDLNVRGCIKNYKRSFWPYTLSGFVFMFWVALPVVNLLALPFGVIYFSLLNVKRSSKMLESR